MVRFAWFIIAAFFICAGPAPSAFAADLQTAKVYRDYPGYFSPPTCVNPVLSADKTTSEVTLPKSWNSPNAWTISPMAGYHVFDGSLDLEDQFSIGLAVGYNLTPNWALEADVRFTPTQTDFSGGGNVDVNVWTISGGALYHFMPEQRFDPYLAFGLGGIVYDIDKTTDNDEDYMGYWGGGVKYALNSMTALRVDLRHLIDYRSDSELNSQDGSDWCSHLSAMAGVTFQFGN